MYGKKNNVSERPTAPRYDMRDSVSGRATSPMYGKWDSLASKYGWMQLTYDSARTTSKVVGGGVRYGHGSTTNHQSGKWFWVCTIHGARWCSVYICLILI